MNHRQIALVQESWRKALAKADVVALLFHMKLLAVDPSPPRTVKADQLVAMITVAVNGLSRIETLVPVFEVLGRHRYSAVAEALLRTLEQCLGKDFTPETKRAWIEACGRVEAKAA